MRYRLFVALLLVFASSAEAKIVTQSWDTTADDGRKANLFALSNSRGMEVKITNYGGVVVSIRTPDRDGKMADVVQGFDSLTDYTSANYIGTNGHYGALIGRFARKMNIADVYQGCKDKAAALQLFAQKHGLALSELGFMGDDINDVGALKLAGLAAAPADAHSSARDAATFVAKNPGGHGAVRELLDSIIQ